MPYHYQHQALVYRLSLECAAIPFQTNIVTRFSSSPVFSWLVLLLYFVVPYSFTFLKKKIYKKGRSKVTSHNKYTITTYLRDNKKRGGSTTKLYCEIGRASCRERV